MVTEFVYANVGPLFTENKTCFLALPHELLNEIMSPPGF
jgi:hypothetical protein